jgi:hypothetical protein
MIAPPPSHHGWVGSRDVMAPEEWEAIAIRFRAEVGIVPYNIWRHLTPDSKDWVGGLVQERAQRILANLDAVIPVNLTAATNRVAFEDMATARGQSRDTAYLLRLVDAIRRGKTTNEIL